MTAPITLSSSFGAGSALVALDLNSFEFDALLRRDHFKEDEETPIRWM